MAKFFIPFVAGYGVKNNWVSIIYYYITTLLLFHFFRNSQQPEK